MQPTSVKARRPHEENWEEGLGDYGGGYDSHHDEEIDLAASDRTATSNERDVILLRRGEDAEGMQCDALDLIRSAVQVEEIDCDLEQIRRAGDLNLGVKVDDDRMGVVSRVAPSPKAGFADGHEG